MYPPAASQLRLQENPQTTRKQTRCNLHTTSSLDRWIQG